MPVLNHVWFAMVTADRSYAGTDSSILLIINTGPGGVDHGDFIHFTIPDTAQSDQERGQANLYEVPDESMIANINTEGLNPSSIRVGIRGSDMWRPNSFFVWGREQRNQGVIVPLGLIVQIQRQVSWNTSIAQELSTDADEGALSVPVPRVEPGNSSTLIKSLLLIMRTADVDDAGTDNRIRLQITTIDGQVAVDHTIIDTPQDDQERAEANLYFIPVRTPFTQRSLYSDPPNVHLTITGDDAWLPASFFLFGLDVELEPFPGDVQFVTPLVHLEDWPFGTMSTDASEGVDTVTLPLAFW